MMREEEGERSIVKGRALKEMCERGKEEVREETKRDYNFVILKKTMQYFMWC